MICLQYSFYNIISERTADWKTSTNQGFVCLRHHTVLQSVHDKMQRDLFTAECGEWMKFCVSFARNGTFKQNNTDKQKKTKKKKKTSQTRNITYKPTEKWEAVENCKYAHIVWVCLHWKDAMKNVQTKYSLSSHLKEVSVRVVVTQICVYIFLVLTWSMWIWCIVKLMEGLVIVLWAGLHIKAAEVWSNFNSDLELCCAVLVLSFCT